MVNDRPKCTNITSVADPRGGGVMGFNPPRLIVLCFALLVSI